MGPIETKMSELLQERFPEDPQGADPWMAFDKVAGRLAGAKAIMDYLQWAARRYKRGWIDVVDMAQELSHLTYADIVTVVGKLSERGYIDYNDQAGPLKVRLRPAGDMQYQRSVHGESVEEGDLSEAYGFTVGKFYSLQFRGDDSTHFYVAGTLKNGNASGFQVSVTDGRPRKAAKKSLHRDEASSWTEVSFKNLPKGVQKKFKAKGVEESTELEEGEKSAKDLKLMFPSHERMLVKDLYPADHPDKTPVADALLRKLKPGHMKLGSFTRQITSAAKRNPKLKDAAAKAAQALDSFNKLMSNQHIDDWVRLNARIMAAETALYNIKEDVEDENFDSVEEASDEDKLRTALWKKFPRGNKEGRKGNRRVMLTGDVAKRFGAKAYSSLQLDKMEMGDLKKLASAVQLEDVEEELEEAKALAPISFARIEKSKSKGPAHVIVSVPEGDEIHWEKILTRLAKRDRVVVDPEEGDLISPYIEYSAKGEVRIPVPSGAGSVIARFLKKHGVQGTDKIPATIREEDETEVGDLEEAKLAKTSAYSKYIDQADADFLTVAAKEIKKIAGGHAVSVEMKRGRAVSWLEYHGEDRSDMEMEFNAHVLSISNHDAKLFYNGKTAMGGTFDEERKLKIGVLTPETVVQTFRQYFG